MKPPSDYDQRAATLEPFVIAAKSPGLSSACELLLVHGDDLAWGAREFGLFVVDADVEDMDDTIEVDRARGELGFIELLRRALPFLRSAIADVAKRAGSAATEAERQAAIGAFAAQQISSKKSSEFDRLIPDLMRLLPSLSGWLASASASAALDLRNRQLEASGLDEEDYGEMVAALERLSGAALPIYRVSVPAAGGSAELSIAGATGFGATMLADDSEYVEVLRLAPWLAVLKSGEEVALPLFLAHYINSHYPGAAAAFPGARWGGKSGPEIDVAIPHLAVGLEVKLLHAPASIGQQQIDAQVPALVRQLKQYRDLGCVRAFVITNLPEAPARYLASRLPSEGDLTGLSTTVISERLDGVLPLLDALVAELQPKLDEELGLPKEPPQPVG
ncbi:MAG: hypothetical protein IT379_29310 [Deltaproteobacteria bacterium]|nr:hypothetical protein [Deltaproteobacteria bacterium]